jgi:magnesium transporter
MTAGGIALAEHSTVGDAVAAIRSRGDDTGFVNYLYVVDPASRLVGVVSMRDLVLARPHATLSRIKKEPVVAVRAEEDREAVARLLHRHRYLALPVVDGGGRLLGHVTAEDVMNVMDEEATGDVQQMFGAGADERLSSPWHFSFRKRLPWLLVNLALATLGASVVGFFQGTIGAWTALAVYLPVVAGTGGNASAQAMAVAIRGIAVGDSEHVSLRRVIGRELRVGAATGLVIGCATAVIVTVLHFSHGLMLGLLVAVSMLINHTVACAWGAALPFVMKRFGLDPAQSATIFTTTLTDMVGFFTLLGLATASLSLLR